MPRGARGTLVCELVGSGRGAAARPAFEPGNAIPLAKRARANADVGDLVTVALRGGGARVVARHGPVRSPRAAIAALMASEELGRPFPPAALEEAEEATLRAYEEDPGRRDRRAQRVLTIDPEGAKDHDDAIAVRAEAGGIRLWVHIADVAHFVSQGGAVDREAARRGCSVYLPGTVDPMLPARLSTDLCSLRPGVDRKAVTVEMLVDADGEVRESRFTRSLIRSDRRLTYPQVDACLAGGTVGDPLLDADLAVARELAGRLRGRRLARGALEVATAEPVFRWAGDRVVDVHLEGQTEAHSVVEECMIAANEAVAAYLIARGRPTVFRFHEDPAQQRIERLYAQLDALGVATPLLPEGPLAPAECRRAAERASQAVARHLRRGSSGRRALPALVLRALRQAYYAVDRVGHSGLASPAYLHFTSPIRRYPDLLVHRALLDALGLGDPAPDPAWLAEAAERSSVAERAAGELEHRGDRLCLAYLLEDVLARRGHDAVWEGEVTGVIDAGLFLVFGEAFEGFLPARRLGGDFFRPDPLETAMVGVEGGRRIRLGDVVRVRVVRVERLRGRVDLEPADAPAPARAPAAPRGRRVRAGRAR